MPVWLAHREDLKTQSMKRQLLSLFFSAFSILAYAQTTQIDSLRAAIANADDSIQVQLCFQLYEAFRAVEAWDSCLLYSQKASGLALAAELRDTNTLRTAYFNTRNSYFSLKDSLLGQEFDQRFQELSRIYGFWLDNDYTYSKIVNSSYRYSLLGLYNSLSIFCDSSRTLDYEEIRRQPFSRNTSRNNFDPDQVYWMQLRLVAPPDQEGVYYFGIGGGLYSWKRIDVYYEQGDSLVHQKTGLGLLSAEKSIKDALNLIKVSLDPKEEARLFIRVEGANTAYPPGYLRIQHLKMDSVLELEGYRFLGEYSNPHVRQVQEEHNFITRSLEIVKDSAGVFTLDEVKDHWAEQARFNDWSGFESDQVYWAKFRLLGNPQFYGQQLFSVGNNYLFGWNKVDVFVPNPQGGYDHQLTGNGLPLWKRFRAHTMNLFTVDLAPSDTLEVFLRLEDRNRLYPSSYLYFYHFNQATFWNTHLWNMVGTVLFIGVYLTSFLYFFLFFIMTRHRMYLYLALAVFFMMQVLSFSETSSSFFVFSQALDHLYPIQLISQTLGVIFLLLFTQDFLELKKWKIRWRKGVPILIAYSIIMVLVILYFFYKGNWEENANWLLKLPSIQIALSAVLVLAHSIIAFRKGNQTAKYFLWAIIVNLVLWAGPAWGYLLGDSFSFFKGRPVFSLLVATSFPILLGLAMGYRSREQEKQTKVSLLAEGKARAKAEAAQAANEAKSSFLNTVSHELRTPLTSIIGFTKLNAKNLKGRIIPKIDPEDAATQKTATRIANNQTIIQSESERLLTLINDLLDLAKIESGKVDWKSETVQPGELVERAIQTTTSLFVQKPDLGLVKNLEADLPAFTGDPDRLLQVMINLISNAVKFTEQGEVSLVVKQDQQNLQFSVSDTGMGIPADYLDKVFQRFQQVENDQEGKPKGTGLGLPICREIVEHHGGEIWVESEEGQGSTFFFTVPLNR